MEEWRARARDFMMIAPLYKRLSAAPDMDVQLVHTGLHDDEAMSDVFFRQLGLSRAAAEWVPGPCEPAMEGRAPARI